MTEQVALARVRHRLANMATHRAAAIPIDVPDLRALCDELEAKRRECEAARAYIEYMDKPWQEHDHETLIALSIAYDAARKGKARSHPPWEKPPTCPTCGEYHPPGCPMEIAHEGAT